MSQQELLIRVISALEASGIEYMVTGSLVSSLQGEPRSTHDIDILLALPSSSIPQIVAAFPAPDYYLDPDAIEDAVNRGGIFNLIDVREGDKVDFWILTDEPFDRSRFFRRYVEHFPGIDLRVSSPEDTILAKLRWAHLSGGSEKQFIDALRVFEVQSERLDHQYLERWANELHVEELWTRLKE